MSVSHNRLGAAVCVLDPFLVVPGTLQAFSNYLIKLINKLMNIGVIKRVQSRIIDKNLMLLT